MPLAGKQLLPRQIAALGAPHWHTPELVKMVATSLGESAGFVGAWHDNPDGTRDCGLMQDNIPAADIGTSVEAGLRSESLDPKVYEPIAEANVLAGYRLYEEPGSNAGLRRWEPWVAYTTGWATFTSWWSWQQINGKPVGPWIQTGRYLQRALVGVANYHLLIAKNKTEADAVALAEQLAAAFHVDGSLGISAGIVAWTAVPPKPSAPPADGIGPRPVPNNGA